MTKRMAFAHKLWVEAEEYDALAARLAEAERLLQVIASPWPSEMLTDGSVIVSQKMRDEIRAFLRPTASASGVKP